jgi:hypothetical protein
VPLIRCVTPVARAVARGTGHLIPNPSGWLVLVALGVDYGRSKPGDGLGTAAEALHVASRGGRLGVPLVIGRVPRRP